VTAVVDGKAGSPTLGQEVERYAYDPYGAVTVIHLLGPSPNWAYLFQGGRYDAASGLYDFREREDNPALGRWMQNDPMGFAAGDANLYRYVGDNPANATDPAGLFQFSIMHGPDFHDHLIIHDTNRPCLREGWRKNNDPLWRMAFGKGARHCWDVEGSRGAKEILEKLPDDSIKDLYLNAHCGESLTEDLKKADADGAAYRKLIKSKLKKGATIHIFSCFQGQNLDQRKKLQKLADETGAVVWAKTDISKSPWGGGSGVWLKYTPGGEVPYPGGEIIGADGPPKGTKK
jgi:RHS repeat-associated protein